jgi:hypothetical protein
MKNKSLLNPGNLFILTYCVYFLFFPFIYFVDSVISLNLHSQDLIFKLYESKGLKFLTNESLFLILSGLTSFVLGYFFIFSNLKINKVRILNIKWPYRNILLSSVGFFIAGTSSKILGVINGAHLHFHFSDSFLGNNLLAFFSSLNILHLASLALIILGFFLSKIENDKAWSLRFFRILIFFFPMLLIISLNFGGKMTTIAVFFSLIVIFSYSVSSIKKQVIIFASLVLIVLLLIITKTFMASYINLKNSALISEEPPSMTFQSIINLNKSIIDTIAGRVNMTHIFTEVTLRDKQLLKSESSFERFSSLVKESRKPMSGNLFGKEYGFIGSTDDRTGVGKTIIGGFYLYFGTYGVIFGMFLLGLLYKLINETLTTNFGMFFYSIIVSRLMSRVEMDVIYLLSNISLYVLFAIITHMIIMENGVIDKAFLFGEYILKKLKLFSSY